MDYADTTIPKSDEEAVARIGDDETLCAKYEDMRQHLNINMAWECIQRTLALTPMDLELISSWMVVLKESTLVPTGEKEAALADKLRRFHLAQKNVDHYAVIAIRGKTEENDATMD